MKTYKILSASNSEELARQVNNNIRAGFVCQGGVSVSLVGESEHQTSSVQLAQAMTYEKKETQNDT